MDRDQKALAPQLRFVPLAELVPYARNARKHGAEQVAQIAASMVQFGWTNPVLADEQGIVCGHGRVLAAEELYKSGKAIKLPDGRQVPQGAALVLDCTGWDEKRRRAYMLADNRLPMNAEWDFDVLASELDELAEDGWDVSSLGFSDDEFSPITKEARQSGVREMPAASAVADDFWISIRGPLSRQAEALQKLRTLMSDMPLKIEIGTIEGSEIE